MKGASLFKSFTTFADRVKVESDVGYTFSTDQYLRGSFRMNALVQPDEYTEDWYAAPEIVPSSTYTVANFPEEENEYATIVDLKHIDPLLLNKSLVSAKLKPTASYNYIECFPSFQADILPYLTDTRLRDSQLLTHFQDNDVQFTNEDFVDRAADKFFFSPSVVR